MKRKIFAKVAPILTLFVLVALPNILFAQSPAPDISYTNPLSGISSIPEFIKMLLRDVIIPIAIPVIVVMIIVSGFMFVTARGDTTKLQRARVTLVGTIIGAAIILGSMVLAAGICGTIDAITPGSYACTF